MCEREREGSRYLRISRPNGSSYHIACDALLEPFVAQNNHWTKLAQLHGIHFHLIARGEPSRALKPFLQGTGFYRASQHRGKPVAKRKRERKYMYTTDSLHTNSRDQDLFSFYYGYNISLFLPPPSRVVLIFVSLREEQAIELNIRYLLVPADSALLDINSPIAISSRLNPPKRFMMRMIFDLFTLENPAMRTAVPQRQFQAEKWLAASCSPRFKSASLGI